MRKIVYFILVLTGSIIYACESKKDTDNTGTATADTTATVDSTNMDTTSMYEKQHYGNGNTETSGNSGH